MQNEKKAPLKTAATIKVVKKVPMNYMKTADKSIYHHPQIPKKKKGW